MDNLEPQNELKEENYIQEGYSKNPFPFWFWLFMVAIIASLLWGGKSWLSKQVEERKESSPFLHVTNREFSLFLWQFPEYLRVNRSQKTGYLPAFQYLNKVTVEPEMADQLVVAPPEVLFLYHTWKRLLGGEFFPSPIPIAEFKEFLEYSEEWQPKYWPQAPSDYVSFVKSLREGQINDIDLQVMPEKTLPQEVRRAFQGWTNYFKQGESINRVKPSHSEMVEFLKENPHYERNYWRNILLATYPKYLLKDGKGGISDDAPLPENQLAPFLKVAYFNYQHAYHKAAPYLIIGAPQS